MARIPLQKKLDLPEEYQYLMDEDVLGARNIFRAIGNNPPILKSYMLYGTTVWNNCGLTAHDRELVILAIGRTLDSQYEWEQHVEIGFSEDVTPKEIRAIGGDDLSYFDDSIAALLEYTQAFARNEMTDEIHKSFEAQYDNRTVTGVGMLSSYYIATAFMLETFDIDLEQNKFIGWEPSDGDVHSLTQD